MNTRMGIIETARKLFNQLGIKQVTVRRICAELEISPGSFSHYFPDRSKLVKELYAMMLNEFMQLIEEIPIENPSILHYLEAHQALFDIQLKYKFFYLNLFEILSQHKDVREIYLRHRKVEQEMAEKHIRTFVQAGVLEREIPESQLSRMISVGQILNNSWLIDAEINFTGNKQRQLIYYMNLCCGLLEPYLSQAEVRIYKEYFAKLESA